ncbi:hypothetical protein CEUSTIGMA_g3931.t1 [Chlamydomonas eustigma]|uniref:C2H2-type domain-containing protein n=1 Tax=Chlamydomonas eustigma TaxID=1157962 RepID=A0A250X0A4_9CHLO|nr:hypothetical protein CEUSTIGMA_g3931.t1 [Chlamydomonas eustigma]|eukprot:GAX76486.1 hypothetical protein CEUSTIGMA_g3931.t1 [Chlamydomonas eustigma]
MGKADFMSPKAIGNRIKAKGLQKLRWYCQLCQKQCRDENGFKCHQMSDSHRRQMEVFGQNPGKVVHEYSAEFERDFMDHLKRAHPFSRVSAKVVYNEFISDRHHVHMNSTKWLTLTSFVQYLGREGKCKVDETPKGWFITLIQKDPMEELGEEKRNKRLAAEKEEEERHLAALKDQAARARKVVRTEDNNEQEDEAHELRRDESQGPLVLGMLASSSGAENVEKAAAAGVQGSGALFARHRPPRPLHAAGSNPFNEDDDEDDGGVSRGGGAPAKRSKLDELMQKEIEAKASKYSKLGKPERLDNWLHSGIVVKVMSKELKEHGYYKQKGKVLRIIDKYVGEIEMLESGDIIRVDQAQLETVIPSPGGTVLVVNGIHRGCHGSLVSIDTTRFQALIELADEKGKEVWLEYEDICKKS